jgi:hypothetical protein
MQLFRTIGAGLFDVFQLFIPANVNTAVDKQNRPRRSFPCGTLCVCNK